MRTEAIAAVLALSLSAAGPQRGGQQRGSVSEISASPAVGAAMEFTVRGTNPCDAVSIDFGEGTAVRHPIRAVPATIRHTYARAGTYQVLARGVGTCDGQASMTVRVAAAAKGGAVPRGNTAAEVMRFEVMDGNNDGVVTRKEWRGSAQSFRVHDWNNDGQLSGDEVRVGGRRQWDQDPDYAANRYTLDDWSERRFAQLDANRDGRLARREWHYSPESFLRADRNRDGVLTRAEFLDTTVDDDRDDQFDHLDLNGNNRIEQAEWHASRQAFLSLDRNGDGVLSRAEAAGENPATADQFTSLDMNQDRTISAAEWQWSRASFDRLDRNRDGRLNRAEFEAAGPLGETGASAPIIVSATDRWTDTGISVRAGDMLSFNATGSIGMAANEADIADPQGARSGRRAQDAPLPREPAGMLLARIGVSAPIAVGNRTAPIRAAQDGRLYLGVNDDHLGDNSGEFRVTVTVRRGGQ